MKPFVLILVAIVCWVSCAPNEEQGPKMSVPYLTPEEQAETFVLPEGYRLELVVGDPIIKEPVAAVFDGDGRMYVAEMRSFMQNVEGTNQLVNNSVISLHWSSERNGIF